MPDLTTDRATPKRGIIRSFEVPVAANAKIPGGVMVAVTTASGGYAVSAVDAAGGKILGVAKKMADNTGGAAGAISVEVENGLFEFDATSIVASAVGTLMYAIDNHTFDETATINNVKAGLLVRFISSSKGEILIDPICLI